MSLLSSGDALMGTPVNVHAGCYSMNQYSLYPKMKTHIQQATTGSLQ